MGYDLIVEILEDILQIGINEKEFQSGYIAMKEKIRDIIEDIAKIELESQKLNTSSGNANLLTSSDNWGVFYISLPLRLRLLVENTTYDSEQDISPKDAFGTINDLMRELVNIFENKTTTGC